MKNAIVVVCDGLSPRYLAPYGNAGVPTPAWSRQATEASLFEFMLVDDPRLSAVYSSFFSGSHAACPERDPTRLAAALKEQRVRTAIVSDELEVIDFATIAEIEDAVSVPLASRGPVEDLSDSQFAEVLGAAIGWLEQAADPYLLWIHSRGMNGIWDAPYEMRTQFADEDDPDPPADVEPPRFSHDDGDDDLLLGWRQAYSAQVMLWDLCLPPFLDQLDQRLDADRTTLVMTAPRGYPLGEHGQVGFPDNGAFPLYGELLHMPLLWRSPDREGSLLRHRHLVQPADLCAALLDWFDVAESPAPRWQTGYRAASFLPLFRRRDHPWRDRLLTTASGQQGIRTGSWQLRHELDSGRSQLFAKPEDVWERNDVADRCEEEVEQLRQLIDDYLGRLRQGGELLPLPANLEFSL